jgi:signal transduction histidine kinase
MKYKLKPAPRLIVVFVLAIFISGSVLTYFSINNISNQEELTEKKILEEERVISARFRSVLQSYLDSVTSGFGAPTRSLESLKEILIEGQSRYDWIMQPFILDSNGCFIHPNLRPLGKMKPQTSGSGAFIQIYKKGETAEFALNNLNLANRHYLNSLSLAALSVDTARVLNAVGRIAVKQGNPSGALRYYRQLISDYAPLLDDYGFPFAYYAMQQVVQIADKNHSEEIIKIAHGFLKQLSNGTIPLNAYSHELLADIMPLITEDNSIGNRYRSDIDLYVKNLNDIISFYSIYGKDLSGLLNVRNSDTYGDIGHEFRIRNGHPGNTYEVFLIRTTPAYQIGFLINRQKLLDTIRSSTLQESYTFSYEMEIATVQISGQVGQGLMYSSTLTPWFPDVVLHISPKDEDLITDLIRRRSWIYGIASLLLMLAMLLGVVLIMRDIRREKHLARLRADFISNVTHELKTPLTSIRMYAESLMMGRMGNAASQKTYLSIVISESERLKRMINNILEFSKMEKAGQKVHPVITNLSKILRASIQDLNYWLEERHFKVITDIDTQIMARVDPDKLRQVYTNLLNNAVKYSEDLTSIRIRLYRNSKSIITEIEDQGRGIPEDQLNKIFDKFYRVEAEDQGNIAGTGLGLTVAREIMKAHGGSIKVESKIGIGSKFSVILPEGIKNEQHSDHRG